MNEEKKIVITIEGANAREISDLSITFRDGRPVRTETTSRTDDNGHVVTQSVSYPIMYNRNNQQGKKYPNGGYNKYQPIAKNPVISPEKAAEIEDDLSDEDPDEE